MYRFSTLLTGAVLLVLGGCGSAPEEPVEQIVVREPGAAEKASAASSSAPPDLISKGKAAFAVCSACHSVEAGAAAGPGPNLRGVIGRKAGSVEGYGFTDAMKSSGIVWTEAEIDSFLTNPTAKVPGTSMVSGAVSDPEARKAIIAYLTDAAK